MSAWNGTMKWCIRNCEEEGPVDLNELKYLLMAEDNTDEFDTSALHLACVGNNAAIIKLLIAYNVPVNGTDKDGATPLHWACSKGNLDSVIALLHAKADIKATDYDGNSILHYAVQEGHLHIVKYILSKYKMDIEEKNEDDKTVLQIACEEEDKKMIRFLLSKGAQTASLLTNFVKENNTKAIQLLLKYGDISETTYNHIQRNPLHYAILFDKIKIVKLLIRKQSWLLDCEDIDGRKPKDYLNRFTNQRLVKFFE